MNSQLSWKRMMFRLLLILCFGHCLPADVGTDLGIDAHIGDTVMLPCDGPAATDNKNILFMWLTDGRRVISYEDGIRCEFGPYVTRTWFGSIRQNNFSLVINPVRKEDTGVYMCRINGTEIRSIRLNVKGGRKRRGAETPPGDPACRPYREREDPPESVTKDKQDSDKIPPEASSGRNQVVIVGIVVIVVAAVGAAVLFKYRNRQR